MLFLQPKTNYDWGDIKGSPRDLAIICEPEYNALENRELVRTELIAACTSLLLKNIDRFIVVGGNFFGLAALEELISMKKSGMDLTIIALDLIRYNDNFYINQCSSIPEDDKYYIDFYPAAPVDITFLLHDIFPSAGFLVRRLGVSPLHQRVPTDINRCYTTILSNFYRRQLGLEEIDKYNEE